MSKNKIIFAKSVTNNGSIDKGLFFDGPGTSPIETGINPDINYTFDLSGVNSNIEKAVFHFKVLKVYTDYDKGQNTYLKYFERRFLVDGEEFYAYPNNEYTKELSELKDIIAIEENMVWTNYEWTEGKVDVHCYIDFDSAENTYLEIFFGAPTAEPIYPIGEMINPSAPVKFSWRFGYNEDESEIQESAVIEWKSGENGNVNTVQITSANKFYDFPQNTFNTGSTIYWRVKSIGAGETAADFSEWVSFTTYIAPVIYSLEPDGINQNREKNIIISWIAENYNSFKLDVLTANSLITSYNGTTETQLIIPAGTVPKGNISLKLKLTYNSEKYTTYSTKEVAFLAYGYPQKPRHDATVIYNTATPTFTWETENNPSDTPVSWEAKLFRGAEVIESSGEILGNSKKYTAKTLLENKVSYVFSVRVKNQFNLWSEWSDKAFTPELTELDKAEFDLIINDNAVLLNIKNSNDAMFKNSEVWRRESGNEWIRVAYNLGRVVAYTDHTLRHGTVYEYKIRSIAYDGGVSESDVKTASMSIKGFEFINAEDFKKRWVVFGSLGDKNISVETAYHRNIDYTVYQGNLGATIETDNIVYQEFSFKFNLSFDDFNALSKLIYDCSIMLYKDERGHKCYGYVISDISERHIDFNGYEISFGFMQVSFSEEDMYKGDGGIVPLYFDGSCNLNGTTLLNGVKVI